MKKDIVIKRKNLTPLDEQLIRKQLEELGVGTVECVVVEAKDEALYKETCDKILKR